jgi:hypothetical protein
LSDPLDEETEGAIWLQKIEELVAGIPRVARHTLDSSKKEQSLRAKVHSGVV